MAKIIGNTSSPIGTVIFSISGGKLEARIGNRNFFIKDEEIKQKKNKYYVDVSSRYLPTGLEELEIPKLVIARKDEIMREGERTKGTIGTTPSARGTVYFTIDNKGRLVAKTAENEVAAENIELVYGKYAIDATPLELGHTYLMIPEDVMTRYKNATKNRPIKIAFVKQGDNPLNGKTYYRLATGLPDNLFSKVREDFEFFESEGNLKGWLTAYPEIVSSNLGLEYTL